MAKDGDAGTASAATAGSTKRDLPLRGPSNPDAEAFEYVQLPICPPEELVLAMEKIIADPVPS